MRGIGIEPRVPHEVRRVVRERQRRPHPDSPNCHEIRLLLCALDLRYESRRVDLMRWLFWQASGASRRIAAVGKQRQVHPALESNAWCRGLHGIEHVQSLLATQVGRMICVFEAPDMEAVRLVARRMGFRYERM